MKILAIDASTKNSGYAVYDNKELKESGSIYASSTDVINRIKKMIDGFRHTLSKYKVDKVILEEVLPDKGFNNLKTHKALMYLQCMIVYMIHEEFKDITVEFVYPSEWRAAVGIHTGRGIKRSELKDADIRLVKEKFNIPVEDDDQADAILIGWGYLNKNTNSEMNWE